MPFCVLSVARIVSTGLENEHSLCVWNWEEEEKVASCNIGPEQIFACKFHPTDGTIMAVGVKSVKVFRVTGSTLTANKGIFGSKGTIQSIMCLAYTPAGAAVTGAFNGDVYVWQGNNISAVVPKAHQGAVLAIAVGDSGTVYTGGNDGKVKAWDDQKETWSVDLKAHGAVRSVSARGGNVVVGTAKGKIVYIDGATRVPTVVMTGHWLEETWGLALPASGTKFATSGDEGSIRLWDGAEHKEVVVAELGSAVRGLAWSPAGDLIAAGTAKGEVVLMDAHDLSVKARATVAKSSLDELKFSPDGARVACGSHDSQVVIVDAHSAKKLGVLTGHHEAVWHIDWSADGAHLQTNSRGYELLFWDSATYKQVTSATAMRDVEWATWTCTLGWPVQGIWPKFADGTDVNSVDRAHNSALLATGDDFGKVNLFKYPCVTKGAKCQSALGHSSHVPAVRFTADDSHLISTGGHDRAVIQWKHTQ